MYEVQNALAVQGYDDNVCRRLTRPQELSCSTIAETSKKVTVGE